MSKNKYLQLGIFGIAENKEFNDALGVPTKQIKRVALAEFIRNKCNLTGRDFAKKIGVSPATISKWLYTETMPSIRVVKSISTHYNVTIEYVDELFSQMADTAV